MIGLMDVSKCLGCDEMFCGSGLCPDCVRMDAIYESRRLAKAKMLDQAERKELISKLPRTDAGVVFYAGVSHLHLAPALAVLLSAVIVSPFAAWGAWHYGKLLIAFLCGVR